MFGDRNDGRSERGFTLVEVTIILLVLVILSTIMLPQLGNFNRLARFVVVSEDVGAICASLKKMLDEVMLPGPYSKPGGSGTPVITGGFNRTGLLVGPGSIPSSAQPATYKATLNGKVDLWTVPVDPVIGNFSVTTDRSAAAGGASQLQFDADLLEYHLQINAPLGNGSGPAWRYKNVIDDPSVGAFFGWRGPYFNELNADPWGTRYSVNTFGLHGGPKGPDDIYMTAVICISFGPNKQANTEANMPGSAYGGPDYEIGGDDIAAILSAAGPF
jgi:type II secretory pathway pseudopilin PulG